MSLTARHIQNFTGESNLEPHWGYAGRVVPCKNDPGSCEYLDVVYHSHDLGMLYSGIFWATIGAVLLIWAIGRRFFPSRTRADLPTPDHDDSKESAGGSSSNGRRPDNRSRLTRLRHAIASASRRRLLPNAARSLFGHTTRLQVLILAVLIGYLTVWSFVGIVYKTWVTPIKGQPDHVRNTRTSLGPWADRVGVLAYALTPLSILLASRESLLSLLTGVPYTSFMFLHRWTGYIILAQSLLHTLGWVIVEAALYKPQPTVWTTFMANQYAIWGFVALGVLVLLWLLSLNWTIRRTGYEFFRKAHYVLAMVYIGAVIGHWVQLQCFLVPGLVLWACDRLARLVRMAMLHYGWREGKGRYGFAAAHARARFWPDDKHGGLVRLDFDHPHRPWSIGQHFFLCFAEGSIWQSHPFTPLSLPVDGHGASLGLVRHSYIFRAKSGETRKIADLIRARVEGGRQDEAATTTPVILQGPYGESIADGITAETNVLCVAGGTGVTYVLPLLLSLVRERPSPDRKLELLWSVKRGQDVEWIEPELEELRRYGAAHGLKVRIVVTDDGASGAGPAGVSGEKALSGADAKEIIGASQSGNSSSDSIKSGSVSLTERGRPDVGQAVVDFVAGTIGGPTKVVGSGPPGMIGDLRAAVAQSNSGSKVWKGDQRFDVSLICDDRLEW